MRTDNALARLQVTLKCNGDIGLRRGEAQKFPKVEFTHLLGMRVSRSLSVVMTGVLSKPLYRNRFPLCSTAEVAKPGQR